MSLSVFVKVHLKHTCGRAPQLCLRRVKTVQ
jgi:hypothetical protein